MKRLLLLPLLLACAFLVGCFGTIPPAPPIIQIVTEYKLVTPDESMVQNCYNADSATPFDSSAYSKLEWSEKEKTLFDFIDQHLVILELCNKQDETLRLWFIKQKNIYAQDNDKKGKP